MLTEKVVTNKMCLFCASDFHLEMILLPYIKEKIDEYKFVIFTKNDLEDTVNTLLEKVNINDEYKDKIRKINGKNENKLEYTRNLIENKQKLNIIVNGDYNYIENINGKLKEFVNSEIDIIDCYHIEDSNVDITKLKSEYKNILNTKKVTG